MRLTVVVLFGALTQFLALSSADADLRIKIDKYSENFFLYRVNITSLSDAADIKSVKINRGACKSNTVIKRGYHIPLRYGQSSGPLFFPCDPIEVEVEYLDGIEETYTFDDRSPVAGGLSATKSVRQIPDVVQITITSHAEHIVIKNIITNRGSCNEPQREKYPIDMHFGGRLYFMPASCDPLEMTVETDQGNVTFNWERSPVTPTATANAGGEAATAGISSGALESILKAQDGPIIPSGVTSKVLHDLCSEKFRDCSVYLRKAYVAFLAIGATSDGPLFCPRSLPPDEILSAEYVAEYEKNVVENDNFPAAIVALSAWRAAMPCK